MTTQTDRRADRARRAAPAPPTTAPRPLLSLTNLQKHFPQYTPDADHHADAPVKAVDGITSGCGRARPSAWSASPAAASRPPAAPCCGCSSRPAARSSSPARTSPTSSGDRAAPAAPRDADGLPGPLRLAEPAAHGRVDHRRAVRHPGHQARGRHPEGRAGPDGAGRAEPRALQPLPARVLRRPAPAHRRRPRDRPASRSSSSATSRCRPSTCRSRRRSSTCSRTSRTSRTSPTSSSPTTCPSSGTSPTGSW